MTSPRTPLEDALRELIRVSKGAGMNAASDFGYMPSQQQADEEEISEAVQAVYAAIEREASCHRCEGRGWIDNSHDQADPHARPTCSCCAGTGKERTPMTAPSATSRTTTSPRNDPNDTAINILEPYIGRISLEVYEDLQADLAGYIKDTLADEDAALSEERRLERERIKERLPEVLAYHLSDVVGGDPDWSDFASRILDEVSR